MQNRVESVCYGGRPLIHCLFNVCTVRKHSETDAEFYTPAQLLYVGTYVQLAVTIHHKTNGENCSITISHYMALKKTLPYWLVFERFCHFLGVPFY